MNLLMISGDRSILQGKKGAFWYMLEEFSAYWDRIDVICPHVAVSGERLAASSLTADSSKLTAFQNVHFHPSPYGLWYQPRWIVKKGKKLIKEHHHNVMSVHEYPPFYNGFGAEWLSRKTSVPYVNEVHHIVGHPKASSLSELIGRAMSHLFLPHDCMGAAAVRCVNKTTAGVLEKWGAPNEKLFIIPSFYLDREALQPDPSISKEYDVVCIGRMVPNKGLSAVLEAVRSLKSVSCLLIGDGPIRNSLEKKCARWGMADRVTFAGWQPENEDVYRAVQSAKIFIMNSKSEGGPRSALEAMALGMPIITTHVGVMPDVIAEGDNGLFTTGSASDLKEKIQKLLEYSSLQDTMGANARNILKKFERTELIKGYAEFLQSHASS